MLADADEAVYERIKDFVSLGIDALSAKINRSAFVTRHHMTRAKRARLSLPYPTSVLHLHVSIDFPKFHLASDHRSFLYSFYSEASLIIFEYIFLAMCVFYGTQPVLGLDTVSPACLPHHDQVPSFLTLHVLYDMSCDSLLPLTPMHYGITHIELAHSPHKPAGEFGESRHLIHRLRKL